MEITDHVRDRPNYVRRPAEEVEGTYIAQRDQVETPFEISYRNSRISKNGSVEEGRRQSHSIGAYGSNEVRAWNQILGAAEDGSDPKQEPY